MKAIQQAKNSYYNSLGYRISVSRNGEGFWRYSIWRKKPEWFSFDSDYDHTSAEAAFQKARRKVKKIAQEVSDNVQNKENR